MPLVLPYPDIDPVIFQIGPFALRWYALAYIAGLVLGWQYINWLLRKPALWTPPQAGKAKPKAAPPAKTTDIDDLLLWATLGVILGGRIGHLLFYGLIYPESRQAYLEEPLRMLMIWEGGMSFHGGLIGVAVVIIVFSRVRGLDMVRIGDLVACAAPIGLFFGRIANFINGELWGRPTDVPWAMVFPAADHLPRHPSQLYEAALEGLVLFAALYWLAHYRRLLDRPGMAVAIFLFGYGAARAFVELYRDSPSWVFHPDSGLTMGMLLSLPMWAAGGFFLWYALRHRPAPPQPARKSGKP